MKKQIRLRDTYYTIKMAVVFIIGIVLIAYLISFGEKIRSSQEEEKGKTLQSENEVQTVYSFYEPFDSESEDNYINKIDNFFTLQFPLKEEWDESPFDNGFIPDESKGQELIKEYNYKLFLKGLQSDNPYVVWYSAYRLIEFYNSSAIEEIMMALAECEKTTPYQEIKKACEFALDILSNKIEGQEQLKLAVDGTVIFTRFFEGEAGGGQKAYAIRDNLMSELFVWKDQELTATIKEINISPNGEYVWIVVQQENNYFNYVLTLETGKYPYYATTTTLYSTDGEQEAVIESNIKGKWSIDNTLEMTYQGERFTYMPKTKLLKEGYKNDWDTEYNYIAFIKDLKLLGINAIQKAQYYSSALETIREEMRVGTETILLYEYRDHKEMEDLSKRINSTGTKIGNKVISSSGTIHLYKRGRIIILYYGENQQTLMLLNTILGSQFAGKEID